MSAVAEREQFEGFNKLLDRWVADVRRALEDGPLSQEHVVRRWAHTVDRLSAAIDEAVPPSLDAEQVAEIRGDLLAITRSVLSYDERHPLDSYEETLLRLEAIRHIVRDVLDQRMAEEHDARALIAQLEESLPRISRRELAQLLGTSDRSIQRTIAAGDAVEPSRRMLIVARLVALLKRGWTSEGVIAWFDRPRSALDGKTPREALDDLAREQDLLALARSGRAQHGS